MFQIPFKLQKTVLELKIKNQLF